MARAAVEPRIQIGPELEAEYPGASALATACVLNLGYLGGQFEAGKTARHISRQSRIRSTAEPFNRHSTG